jgi:hypothetical protein
MLPPDTVRTTMIPPLRPANPILLSSWVKTALGGAFAVIASGLDPALAGPCTGDILALQAQVDARIDAAAGKGKAGKQSTAAQLHRQPTPQSLANAESKLDEGKPADKALEALEAARKADETGDRAGCTKAVGEARQALGIQ